MLYPCRAGGIAEFLLVAPGPNLLHSPPILKTPVKFISQKLDKVDDGLMTSFHPLIDIRRSLHASIMIGIV